jgi:heptosyltransferase-2
MEVQRIEPARLKHVCVRVPNWVGDVVMATPLLRALRRHLPGARITLVAHKGVAAVLRGADWFDRTVVYDPRAFPAREFLRCAGKLRRERHGLGFVLPNSFSSALMLRLGGVRRRVGYARDCRSFLLTDPVSRPRENGRFKPVYMVDYYLALCERIGVPASGRQTELPFDEADARWADGILHSRGISDDRPLILLHPGAGYGPAKHWPAERFAELSRLLHAEQGARVALIAGRGERETVQQILAAASAPITDLSHCGIDLHLLKCVVARSALLVTTDSGPRHYGVALGVPTVCIMGPTSPAYSTSTAPNDHVVRLDVECGPCQRKRCRLDHRCMAGISAQMVLDTCRAALSQERGAGRDD